MILMTLDFWGVVLLILYLGAFLLIYRFTWWLALGTEWVIAFMTKSGLRAPAKLLLSILIGYDEQTYQKSRFVFWNQAHVRFALLWGSGLLLAGLLWLFHQVHAVDSVGLTWGLVVAAYLAVRCLIYWTRPRGLLIYTKEPALKSLIQDVNERTPPTRRDGRRLIRQYDYLDELFSEPV